MSKPTIQPGDTVEVTHGPNAGLKGKVLNIYKSATEDAAPNAFVEFILTDGPHRRMYGVEYLKAVPA